MKEYTTLEIIEEIMKDNKLEFEAIKTKFDFNKVYMDEYNRIVWKHNKQVLPMSVNIFNKKWIKVQQPVSFMDAVKAYHEGKKIKCVLDDFELIFNFDRNTTKRYGRSILGTLTTTYDYSSITTREILEGAWYIEE